MFLWLSGLTWKVGLRPVKVAGSLLVVVSARSADARKKGGHRIGTPDVSQSIASSSSSSLVFQVGMLFHFWINGDALHLTGLCLTLFRVNMFNIGHALPCSIISSSLM